MIETRQKSRFPLLTVLLCLIVFLYHAAYIFQSEPGYSLSSRFPKRSLSFSVLGKQIHIPYRSYKREASKYIDASSAAIAGLGAKIRYLTGQLSVLAFIGPKDPYQRLYLRTDLRVQYLNAEANVKKNTLPALGEFLAATAARGVAVVAVPIPAKTSIERGRLPARLPSANVWEKPESPFDVEAADKSIKQSSTKIPSTWRTFMGHIRSMRGKTPAPIFTSPGIITGRR